MFFDMVLPGTRSVTMLLSHAMQRDTLSAGIS